MRVLKKKKQFQDVLRNERIEEVRSVEIYEYKEKTYLRVGEEFYDTKDSTEKLYHKLLVEGYADLREYDVVNIRLGY